MGCRWWFVSGLMAAVHTLHGIGSPVCAASRLGEASLAQVLCSFCRGLATGEHGQRGSSCFQRMPSLKRPFPLNYCRVFAAPPDLQAAARRSPAGLVGPGAKNRSGRAPGTGVRVPRACIPRRYLFMSARLIASAALTALLLTSSGLAETPLKSGPQVGERNNRRGFYPQWVAGPATGQRRCPV
jgi:hypothetical protein